MRNIWRHRSIMDMNLLYHELPEKIWPYDYEAYRTNPMRVESVATDCLTGEAVYLEEKEKPERIIDIVRASSALPFACPIAYVDGHPMLDGGIADSIPLQHALDQGYGHIIVVLTRHKGYRKEEKPARIPSFIYRRYPKLREALSTRGARYNAQVELVEQLEREGRITVIRPDHPVDVARIETDMNKMNALYQHGFEVAERVLRTYED
jgi:predicted patatin/cPLA2 family phospholipase